MWWLDRGSGVHLSTGKQALYPRLQQGRARAVPAVLLVRLVAAGLTLLLLNGCGFQLRGSTALPAAMAVTFIKGEKQFDTLNDDFRDALEGRGVRVTDNRSEAMAVLRIQENNKERDVLSVDVGGKVLEFLLRQTIQFDVITADKQPLVERQTVTVSRDFVFNKDDILAKEREADLIEKELQRDAVNLAMMRITAAAK